MPEFKPAHEFAVVALVLLSAWFTGVGMAAETGGYNSMDVKSVYHDNGHDLANAAAMQLGVIRNTSTYAELKRGGHDRGHHSEGVSMRGFRDGNRTVDITPKRP